MKFQYPYTVQDIDIGLKTLVETVSPLSNGINVPVYFEVQQPENGFESYPCISISLQGILPDNENYTGNPTYIAGFTEDGEGNRLAEIELPQPDHYILYYNISTFSKDPLTDRELMLKLATILGRNPVIRLSHLPGNISFHSRQILFENIDGPNFNARFKSANDEVIYQKDWGYQVYASIYNPNSIEYPVTSQIVWNEHMIDNEQNQEDTGTDIIVEQEV